MSDDFEHERPSLVATAEPPNRRRALLATLVTLGLLLLLLAVFTGLWTDRLWFDSIGYADVFITLLGTRVLLFIVFGVLFAGVVAANIVLAHRSRPVVPVRGRSFDAVARYREGIDPIKGRLLLGVVALLLVFAGSIGAGQWSSYLMWRNGVPFNQTDQFFGRDIGFFVFDYPWIRFVLSFLFALIAISAIAVALVHYVYGGIMLQGRSNKLTSAAQVHLSVLIGLFMLLKGFAYWLDRYGLAISEGGLFDGISFTDEHARIPGKNILMVIAIICALLFFANAVWRSWLLPGISLGLLVLSSILLGGVWPAIMQSFQVQPSEPDKEGPYIQKNITATRDAFDLADVTPVQYDPDPQFDGAGLTTSKATLPNTRLLDPTQVSQAFEQLQQVRGYYSVAPTLDVDRYVLDGNPQPQDVVIAAREVDLSGLPSSQRNWANDHTVYTHGYGLIAAKGNARTDNGQPVFVTQGIPLQGQLDIEQPRIYFGENSPGYSIVGRPEGDAPIEVDTPRGDLPSSDTADAAYTYTYDGLGGVDIGGLFTKTLYALKFGEPNIFLSSRVNDDSRIIYDRDPRQRVQKVAPWLTVDGDAYPAVVGGRVMWIVDGYTTTSSYPMSEKVSLQEATDDSLTDTGAFVPLPNDRINYMRNSVKAVVDAYDGTVTLYEWDDQDPILQTWEKVFPDLLQPRSEIPEELLQHFRYPEDIFKVQRDVLSQYHVTEPQIFYEGGERWKIPEDPTRTGFSQPPYYLSVQIPGNTESDFSLTSVYLPNNRQNLAAFISVNAEPTSADYGKVSVLQLPSETQIQGPSQAANKLNNDPGVAEALLRFTRAQNDLKIIYGNLLTLPVGDGLLYVQPVYTQDPTVEGSYPLLQYVLATFGDAVGYGETLDEALRMALGQAPPDDNPPVVTPPDNGNPPSGNDTASQLLDQAQQLFIEADAALREGRFGDYEDLLAEAQQKVSDAAAELTAPSTPTTTPPPSPSPSP